MPIALRMVIDTVTKGSAPNGKIIISSMGAMLRTAVVISAACLTASSLTRRPETEKVAASDADERTGDGRDVAPRAPLLHEEIPVRNKREVGIEEQAQDRHPDRPLGQRRREVGPPSPEAAAEDKRHEDEEKQRPRHIPSRDRKLHVNSVDGQGQPDRESNDGPKASRSPTASSRC